MPSVPASMMRIILNDYAGYAFPVQLSRELAHRGHQVLHLHCANVSAPKGPVELRPDDPPGLTIMGLDIGEPFEKYAFGRRIRHERRYGQLVVAATKAFRPDVFVSSDDPLLAMAGRERWTRRHRIPSVFWLQDIQSIAIAAQARERLPLVGTVAGQFFERLERNLLRRASAVVAITDDFVPTLHRWGVADERITVVPNWAPLDELGEHPRNNPWAADHGLLDTTVFLYAGTLGLKHNPALLLELARHTAPRGNVAVLVASDGLGADWLRAHGGNQENLQVIGFQPFADVPQMQASADVLVSILEPGAATFSVPSKVLNYLAVGRAVLAAIPADNQAARLITDVGAGTAVDPSDTAAFLAAADQLLDDGVNREACAARGRAYAEATFDIGAITDRFEDLFNRVRAKT